MTVACPHITEIRPVPDGGDVCPACVAIDGRWINLRQCLSCGDVGCCDSSPNTHATLHHRSTAHPIMRSVMPGDDWMWCYLCELQFRERDGDYVQINPFFEAGLWFATRRGATGIAGVAPDEQTAEGFPLGIWVTTYRERGRRGELEPEQRTALEGIPAWAW